MNDNEVLILTAHHAEARPFIDGFAMQIADVEQSGISLYRSGLISLCVTGEGRPAIERVFKVLAEKTLRTEICLNFGVGGSRNHSVNSLVQIAAVCGPDEGTVMRLDTQNTESIAEDIGHTVFRPETVFPCDGIYDMELYWIALLNNFASRRLFSVKLVSDGPSKPVSQLKLARIQTMINDHSPGICAIVENLSSGKSVRPELK